MKTVETPKNQILYQSECDLAPAGVEVLQGIGSDWQTIRFFPRRFVCSMTGTGLDQNVKILMWRKSAGLKWPRCYLAARFPKAIGESANRGGAGGPRMGRNFFFTPIVRVNPCDVC